MFMLFNKSMYHRSLGLLSGNKVVGSLSETMTEGQSYMHLRKDNLELLEENARLERSNMALKRYIDDQRADSIVPNVYASDSIENILPLKFLTARIVSANKQNANIHYIINKGTHDSVQVDMPVMSNKGVVGIVSKVSGHYAVVIPLINPGLKLSCTHKKSGVVGTLARTSRSTDLLELTDVPLHAELSNGDTIVTSGYSFIFPENLVVGYVQINSMKYMDNQKQRFSSYAVKTATDFSRLNYVYVIMNNHLNEAKALQSNKEENAQNVD